MKKFIRAATRARSIVKKEYVRELTIELIWLELCEDPGWKYIPWKEFYNPKSKPGGYPGAGTDKYIDEEMARIKRAYKLEE